MGKVAMEKHLDFMPGHNQKQMDVQLLPTGCYTVSVITNHGVLNKKLMKVQGK
jgi:hypothetical protein